MNVYPPNGYISQEEDFGNIKGEKGQPITEEQIVRIFTNPFYCLPKINENLTHEHEPMIDEEAFIKAGVNLIKEIGSEEYLRNLLENLKGNYI